MKKCITQITIMLLFIGCAHNKSISNGSYATLRLDNQNSYLGELKVEVDSKHKVVNNSDLFIAYGGKLLWDTQKDNNLIDHLEHNPEIFFETEKKWLPFENGSLVRTKIGIRCNLCRIF